jgi:tRNA pseudouridine38-40 synthase
VARYQAVLEYDGTDFLGFQRQAAGRTVQGEVEAALSRIGWAGSSLLAAGRTDTGVHASGQVIAFDLEWKHTPPELLRALNATLAADVAVKSLTLCPQDFHPRYRARGRHYRYTIYNAPVRSPLSMRYAWHVASPTLNLSAMMAATPCLVGRHDFATFGNDPDAENPRGANTTRSLSRAEWSAPASAGWLHFDVVADAFLYRMVRSLVGALKQVGAGDLSVSEFEELLDAHNRALCPPLAPPQGLCLVDVLY